MILRILLSQVEIAIEHVELAREGKRIIEARCGLPNYDLLESEMPLLHRVLTQIAPERVHQYLRAEPCRLIPWDCC